MPDDFLLPDSLEWAIGHLDKFGESRMFPRSFELDAIKNNWTLVRNHLTTASLATYPTRSSNRFLVPKQDRLFRVAHQLDPIDALLYTAAVYEASNDIEQSRIPEADHIACSYRVHTAADGNFFANGNGWNDFHIRSRDLSHVGDFTHVVIVDISDCYNQIYHHRVQNSLESAGVSIDRTKNMERLLMRFTAKQSRGLPVGPSSSILLAEVTFNDIDQRLLNAHTTFVRYVDDFNIFCRSYREAIDTLHDLTDYLYTAHRLSLQTKKTKIVNTNTFLTRNLRNPEEQENNQQNARLREMVDEVLQTTGYQVEIEQIPQVGRGRIAMENLEILLQDALREPTDYQALRYVLVRSTALRVRRILPIVLENIEKLLPEFREVVAYLVRVQRPENHANIADKLRHLAFDSDYKNIPYIKMWILQIAVDVPGLMSQVDAVQLCQSCSEPLQGRYEALIAKQYRQVEWVRAKKENWQARGPWERRATIYASSVLPRGERIPWLDTVQEEGDILDQAVAGLVKITP